MYFNVKEAKKQFDSKLPLTYHLP